LNIVVVVDVDVVDVDVDVDVDVVDVAAAVEVGVCSGDGEGFDSEADRERVRGLVSDAVVGAGIVVGAGERVDRGDDRAGGSATSVVVDADDEVRWRLRDPQHDMSTRLADAMMKTVWCGNDEVEDEVVGW
jgi:hypothetical protein